MGSDHLRLSLQINRSYPSSCLGYVNTTSFVSLPLSLLHNLMEINNHKRLYFLRPLGQQKAFQQRIKDVKRQKITFDPHNNVINKGPRQASKQLNLHNRTRRRFNHSPQKVIPLLTIQLIQKYFLFMIIFLPYYVVISI